MGKFLPCPVYQLPACVARRTLAMLEPSVSLYFVKNNKRENSFRGAMSLNCDICR